MPDYIQGAMGKDSCPDGYIAIPDNIMCQKASQGLDLNYAEFQNANDENALCKLCGGCIPKVVGMATAHGKKARMICQFNGK